jgi:hypothetical protein
VPGDEACNGLDDDCDGQADEFLVQACAAACGPGTQTCGSGAWGVCQGPGTVACTDWKTCGTVAACDCLPAPAETCNLLDDDCDGVTDEENAAGCTRWYLDQDADGWGAGTTSVCLCAPMGPFRASKIGDCNDSNAAVNPGAPESCNGADDDCDGAKDEGACGCTPGVEACNGLDDDCDGQTDESLSLPCATECGEGLRNCDGGAWGPCDAPEPGPCTDWGTCGTVESCNCPAAPPEACNGLDDDCDGQTDEGACGCTPGVEACNGKDDDCDGVTDEENAIGCTTWYRDMDADGWGATGAPRCLCAAGGLYRASKTGDCDDMHPATYPGAQEACDGIDNDCDGTADDGLVRPCSSACGSGSETCTAGIWTCSAPAPQPCTDWATCTTVQRCACEPKPSEACNGADDDCDGQTDEGCCVPLLELCNGLDDDCDGYVDEDWPQRGTTCTTGTGACMRQGKWICRADGTTVECDATPGSAVPEACNGLDDDCDGQTDEGC